MKEWKKFENNFLESRNNVILANSWLNSVREENASMIYETNKESLNELCDNFDMRKLPADFDEEKLFAWSAENIYSVKLISDDNFNSYIEDPDYLAKRDKVKEICACLAEINDFYSDNFYCLYNFDGTEKKTSEAGEDAEKVREALKKREELKEKYLSANDKYYEAQIAETLDKKVANETVAMGMIKSFSESFEKEGADKDLGRTREILTSISYFADKYPKNDALQTKCREIIKNLEEKGEKGFKEYSSSKIGQKKIQKFSSKSFVNDYNKKTEERKNNSPENVNDFNKARTDKWSEMQFEYIQLKNKIETADSFLSNIDADDKENEMREYQQYSGEMEICTGIFESNKDDLIDFCDKFDEIKPSANCSEKELFALIGDNAINLNLICNKKFNSFVDDKEYSAKREKIADMCSRLAELGEFYKNNFNRMYNEQDGLELNSSEEILSKRNELFKNYGDALRENELRKSNLTVSNSEALFDDFAEKIKSQDYKADVKDISEKLSVINYVVNKYSDNNGMLIKGYDILKNLQKKGGEDFKKCAESTIESKKMQNILLKGLNAAVSKYNDKAAEQKENINEYLKELEDAQIHDSKEYKNLIKTVKNSFALANFIEEGKSGRISDDYAVNGDEKRLAIEYVKIKQKIDKYLQHKAKDGVNRNAIKKLAAVEKLNQYICREAKKLNIDGIYKEKQGNEYVVFDKNDFKETYKDERKSEIEKVSKVINDKSPTELEKKSIENISSKIIKDTSLNDDAFKQNSGLKKDETANQRFASSCMDRIMLIAQKNEENVDRSVRLALEEDRYDHKSIEKFEKFRDSFIENPIKWKEDEKKAAEDEASVMM